MQARSHGRHRDYMLHPQVYRALGQHAEYVRQAGYEPFQQSEMIRAFIISNGNIRREQVAELCRLAPREAGRLLARLVRSGLLIQRGERRGSHYLLAPLDNHNA